MIHLPKARTPQFAALAATGVFALALSGRGTTDDPSADATSTSQAVSEECAADTTTTSTGPVSLTDSQGRTLELDKPAKRVVVLEWQQTKDLLTLCVTPVGAASIKDYATYVQAETLPDDVADVGERGEPDLDAIYATNPDLIIVEANSPDDELLAKLDEGDVPVLATRGTDTSGQIDNMKEVFSLIAEATGRTERADQVLAEFDEHLASAKEEVTDSQLETTDFVFFDGWIESGNVVIRPYGEGAMFTELGEQLGLTGAWDDDADATSGSGGVDPEYGLAQTDIEGLTAVGDANLIYANDGTEDSYVNELVKSPIWNALPAVKEGRAFEFPAGIWGAGGPRSNEAAIDAFVQVITGK